jgi:hypothetical protein
LRKLFLDPMELFLLVGVLKIEFLYDESLKYRLGALM